MTDTDDHYVLYALVSAVSASYNFDNFSRWRRSNET